MSTQSKPAVEIKRDDCVILMQRMMKRKSLEQDSVQCLKNKMILLCIVARRVRECRDFAGKTYSGRRGGVDVQQQLIEQSDECALS